MSTTISQRELRNDNAAIMRGVEAGEAYTVTRRGVPVARLVPIADEGGLPIVKAATQQGGFAGLPRHKIDRPSGDLLEEIRAERL